MNKHIVLFFLCGMLMTGCKKYLAVQPEGTYTEGQVFTNEAAIKQALNGLYINLADADLYGAGLSCTTIELLGQRFKTVYNGTSSYQMNFQGIQQYNYQDAGLQTGFDNMWKKAYATILAANIFIAKIDPSIQQHIITTGHGNELKGEAVAIRAMLHFDMLRLFGPVYAESPEDPSIPYYTSPDGASQPILPAREVVTKVLADLQQAATLLANDPVTGQGIVNNPDFYTGARNQRLNYYAVKGLLARVYLYGGQNQQAHDAAKAVLEEGEKWFPWMPYTDIVGNDNPDRVFYPEVLFGVYNPDMYNNYTQYFSPNVPVRNLLTADPDRLKIIFENNENDYRYTLSTWQATATAYPTFYKFADLADLSKPWRFVQPLLRKSELYYILAETEADPATAKNYLDVVRHNRGLAALGNDISLPSEVMKEYQKECWGEGQLFFYYKRNNMIPIPDANSEYDTYPSYVVPLPLSETTPR